MMFENNIPTTDELHSAVGKLLTAEFDSDRQKIDELLMINVNLHCQLGSDSSKADKEHVKKLSRIIFRAIKTIDKYEGENFIRTQDGSQYEPRVN